MQRAFFLFNSMSFLGYYGTSEVSILRNALRIDLDDVLASIMKLSSLIPTRLEILKIQNKEGKLKYISQFSDMKY